MSNNILIAGGSGEVGRRIAGELARTYPDRVIIAGRDEEKARAHASAIGGGTTARRIDISDPASIRGALDGVSVVISCIDQPERHLLHAAVAGGLAYTDITPHLMSLGGVPALSALDAQARESGARLIVGAGLAPGISSVMVRRTAEAIGSVESIETSVLLSAGASAGPASMEYLFGELTMRYEAHIDGEDRAVFAFTKPKVIEYPPPFGSRRAYLFPFSDQVFYPKTLGARTAVTHLAIDPPWLGFVIASLLPLGLRSWLTRRSGREAVKRVLLHRRGSRAHRDGFAVVVMVSGKGQAMRMSLSGEVQAMATAIGASAIARALIEREVDAPGAWLPEQVIDTGRFMARLAERGLNVVGPTAAGTPEPAAGTSTYLPGMHTVNS